MNYYYLLLSISVHTLHTENRSIVTAHMLLYFCVEAQQWIHSSAAQELTEINKHGDGGGGCQKRQKQYDNLCFTERAHVAD